MLPIKLSESPKKRARRLVKRAAGWFWRSPYDGVVRFVGATREEADKAIADYTRAVDAELARADALAARRPYRAALDGAISRAQKAGLNVMSTNEFDSLIVRADGCCEVTGIEFSWEKLPGQRLRLWSPSIDRIDSGGHYTKDNCRLVCAAVNVALSDFGVGPLMRIARALVDRQHLLDAET